MDLKDLKAKAHHLNPSVQVGKEGITDAVREEITTQVKRKRMIKVRLLAVAKDEPIKEIGQKLAESCGAVLVQCIGNTITLHKKL